MKLLINTSLQTFWTFRKNSGEAWLSPPSPWIGSIMTPATGVPRSLYSFILALICICIHAHAQKVVSIMGICALKNNRCSPQIIDIITIHYYIIFICECTGVRRLPIYSTSHEVKGLSVKLKLRIEDELNCEVWT